MKSIFEKEQITQEELNNLNIATKALLQSMEDYKAPNLAEIKKLDKWLNNKGIEHITRKLYDGQQIIIERPNKKLSFVIHFGSYGHENGLIEFYNFKYVPYSNLTANDCKKIIRKELL